MEKKIEYKFLLYCSQSAASRVPKLVNNVFSYNENLGVIPPLCNIRLHHYTVINITYPTTIYVFKSKRFCCEIPKQGMPLVQTSGCYRNIEYLYRSN